MFGGICLIFLTLEMKFSLVCLLSWFAIILTKKRNDLQLYWLGMNLGLFPNAFGAAEKNLGRCMPDCGGKRIGPGYMNSTCDWKKSGGHCCFPESGGVAFLDCFPFWFFHTGKALVYRYLNGCATGGTSWVQRDEWAQSFLCSWSKRIRMGLVGGGGGYSLNFCYLLCLLADEEHQLYLNFSSCEIEIKRCVCQYQIKDMFSSILCCACHSPKAKHCK